MKKFISIFIGKMVIIVGKILKRGSAAPGTIAYKFNKKILQDFTLPEKIVAVTGSSGKGSTSKIIADVYKDLGYKVAYNSKGSNERSAIITTLLENCNLKGVVKADICVFEMDERYAKFVFPFIKPTHVVITNITRDQPPRQGHYDFVFEEIKRALPSNVKLILNGDDPYLQNFCLNNEFDVTYYGINKQKYSYKQNKFEPLNIYLCPKCHAKLKYDYYHIEHLGDYHCPKCDFKKPKEKFIVTNCSYDKNTIKINNKYNIDIKNDMLFNLYNTVAAFSYLSLSGLDEKEIAKSISKINNNKKLYNNYTYKYRNVYVLNNKAENATTYNQSILFATRDTKVKTIVLGWKEISRRYNFDDISWLYDINFELLNNKNVHEFICTGPQKYDIATRLKYAGIEEKKIKVFYDLYDAQVEIKKSKGDIYAILNFDYVEPFNEIMGGKK